MNLKILPLQYISLHPLKMAFWCKFFQLQLPFAEVLLHLQRGLGDKNDLYEKESLFIYWNENDWSSKNIRSTTQRQANFLFLFSPLTIVQIEAPSYKGEMYSLFDSIHALKNDFILTTGGNRFFLTVRKANCSCGCTSFWYGTKKCIIICGTSLLCFFFQ